MVKPFDADTMCGAVPRRCSRPEMGECNHDDGEHRCRSQKGAGTDHLGHGPCYLHGGATRNHAKHAAVEKAQAVLTAMGRPVERDPQTALLELVWEAAGNVAFLREQVAAMGPDLVLRVSTIRGRETTEAFVEDADGNEVETARGRMVHLSEDVRAVVKLYGEWSDRLAKYAKAAIDAGIAQRQVELAEAQGYAIRDLIEAVLDGLDLDEDRRRVGREIAGQRLRVLAGGNVA